MKKRKAISRRDFLQLTGSGFAAMSFSSVFGNIPLTAPNRESSSLAEVAPDVEIALRATPTEVSIFPGTPTRTWSYRGEVIQGDASVLQNLPDSSYLGPVLRLKRGQRIRVHFTNEIPQETIVHWHGLRIPDTMDGHPRWVIDQGETFTYDFDVINRAGTYWYHPHPHEHTGEQVYYGMAGLFIVSDDEEAALNLPSGEYDIPLVLQDRVFDSENQLRYLPNGMMDRMMGFLGDTILVNGEPDFTLPVAARAYRLRLLNGSNSRIYKLAWSDGTPLTVIGTDGGLLESPIQRDYVTLAPAERLELWVDFSENAVGDERVLKSLPFSGGIVDEMMGEEEDAWPLPLGAEFTVLRVQIEQPSTESAILPEHLSTIAPYQLEDAVNAANPRSFTVSMRRMNWMLNGRSFEMEGVSSEETVKLDTLEVWEFINQPAGQGMGMEMAHPMHIHGLQFQVIEREMRDAQSAGYEIVRHGYVDEGWKDVVLLMPGERIKLLLKFEDYAGLYLYHCHNLEHEDMGLMRNYLIEA
jgi:blue copper oxidase